MPSDHSAARPSLQRSGRRSKFSPRSRDYQVSAVDRLPLGRHLQRRGEPSFGAPPLGPWRLAFYLRANGQHADVWDCNVSENLRLPSPDEHKGRDRAEVLAEAFVAGMEADYDLSSYEWIGLSILNDTLSSTLGIIELLRKKYPKALLIGGNHEATVNLQDCISKSQLNAIILADAEEPMLALMRGVEPSKIAGVVWRNFNPKPPRESFEKWNAGIKWGEIPYEAYWRRTATLYRLDEMSPEERLTKLQEIHTVRIHTIVACELACVYCAPPGSKVMSDNGSSYSIEEMYEEDQKTRHGGNAAAIWRNGAPMRVVQSDGGIGIITRFFKRDYKGSMVRVMSEFCGVPPVIAADQSLPCRLDLTPGHHVHVMQGQGGLLTEKPVEEICIGDRLRRVYYHQDDRQGRFAHFGYDRVTDVFQHDYSGPVYNLEVAPGHTYVVNGVAVNNCSVANTRRIASGSMKPSIVNLSPNALRDNLLAVKAQVLGVMTIYDSSDEAWLGRGRAEEYLSVLEEIRPIMNAGLERGMRYLIQCRTNDLTEEIIDRAAKVGVRHLTIGIESPVAQVRKDIKKPQGEELIRNAIRWGTARGVNIYGLFIAFLPSITLEQLREAVTNWRIYMELGATVSIEPFCMSYLATSLSDRPDLLTEYAGYDIPFSGGKKLKWATLIWPTDRRVCAVLQWVRANLDPFIEAGLKKLGNKHGFKGQTGQFVVDCIEHALDLYDKGEIQPWDISAEGQRSAVYQDYGDQMSGAEIAAAAKMTRHNKTTTRFNSTHSLLDDTNAGVKGRIKDPALPHEMSPSGLVQLGKPPVKP